MEQDETSVNATDGTLTYIPAPAGSLFDTAIKALDDNGRVGGYLVVWGSSQQKDLQGEYFTPDTELGLDWYTQRPALYHHGLDGTMKSAVIGAIDTLKADDTGLWAEAQLDLRNRYVQAVQKLIERGILAWSSGSLPHLVEIESDGRIKRWPIVEGSMTPTPAEPRQTDIHTIKSAYESLALDVSKLQLPQQDVAKESSTKESTPPAVTFNPITVTTKEGKPMYEEIIRAAVVATLEKLGAQLPDEEVNGLIAQLVESMKPAATAEGEGMAAANMDEEEVKRVAAAAGKAVGELLQKRARNLEAAKRYAAATVTDAITNAPPISRVNGGVQNAASNGGTSHIELRTKHADMSAEDMSYYILMRNAVRRKNGQSPWTPDSAFVRELADKAGKSYSAGHLRFGDEAATQSALKSINFLKANELDHSTQASYGDEWVPDLWSNQLWEKARLDNVIAPLFQMVEMPSNPFELPIQSADPTVYFVPETTAEAELTLAASGSVIPDSKVGTGKVQLSAKKLALRVGFSHELEEDSIIPFVAQLRTQAVRAIDDSIDYVLLNGDTEAGATGNINSDNGAPAATARYMAFNGLRKLPLVTTTANAVDAGNAAPTLAQIRAARFKMTNAYAANPNNIAYICDASTYAKLLSLNEVITVDKYGSSATVMTGEIGKLDGSPVLVTNEMALTESDGKVGSGTNDRGSLVAVYRPGWVVGYRRRINAVMEYLSYYDSYQLTATVRLAFINFDGEVSSILYNIAV